jgi:hypothetical protein
MTQQEIQECNKQIALMLGKYADRWDSNSLDSMYEFPKKYTVHNVFATYKHQESKLKFHSDWNWLMEAVEFIEKSGYNIEICSYHGNDSLHYCAIHQLIDKDRNDITSIIEPKHSNIKIEAVFIVVSDFAKLYNENKL